MASNATIPTSPLTGPTGLPYFLIDNHTERTVVEPFIIGNFIAQTLYGLALFQFYSSFKRLDWKSPKDRWTIVVLVLLCVPDTIDSISKCIWLCDWVNAAVVKGALGLVKMPRITPLPLSLDGWIALVTHVVYIRRILKIVGDPGWRLYSFMGVLFCISVAQFVASIISGFYALRPINTFYPHNIPVGAVWLSGSAIVSTSLSLTFVFLIKRHKSDFSWTNKLINQLVVLTLETGLLPAVLQIVTQVLNFIYKDKSVSWLVLIVILPRIYVNCVLVLLDTTLRVREEREKAEAKAIRDSYTNTKKSSLPEYNRGFSISVMTESQRKSDIYTEPYASEKSHSTDSLEKPKRASLPRNPSLLATLPRTSLRFVEDGEDSGNSQEKSDS